MIKRFFGIALFLLTGGLLPLFAQSDYLMVEYPARLRILNRYAVDASYSEKAAIPSFAPFSIVAGDTVLGDGFTRCMLVRFQGSRYYLLKSSPDSLINQSEAGRVFYARETRAASDTFQVLNGNLALLAEPSRQAQQLFSLINGDILKAHFRIRSFYFVEKEAARPIFGWVRLPAREEGISWKFRENNSLDTPAAVDAAILADLRFEFEKFNRLSKEIYPQLAVGSGMPAPQWVESPTDSAVLRFVLNQPQYQKSFAGSIRYLINNIENRLLGSSLIATQLADRIIIKERP